MSYYWDENTDYKDWYDPYHINQDPVPPVDFERYFTDQYRKPVKITKVEYLGLAEGPNEFYQGATKWEVRIKILGKTVGYHAWYLVYVRDGRVLHDRRFFYTRGPIRTTCCSMQWF